MADNIVCTLQLEDLNKAGSCENRMSGVKTVYYGLLSDVESIPSLPDNRSAFEDFVVLDGDIKMKSGKRLFKFHSDRDLGELVYSLQGTSGGRSWQANLEIHHSGFKKKLLGFCSAVANEELIILARLNNGEIHVLGDIDRGAEFGETVELTSGKAVSDSNGGTLNLVYDTPNPQIYEGDLESLLEVAGGSGSGG